MCYPSLRFTRSKQNVIMMYCVHISYFGQKLILFISSYLRSEMAQRTQELMNQRRYVFYKFFFFIYVVNRHIPPVTYQVGQQNYRHSGRILGLGELNQGLYLLSGLTSYHVMSWSLEAARFRFKLFQSLWNWQGPRQQRWHDTSQISARCDHCNLPRGFEISRD